MMQTGLLTRLIALQFEATPLRPGACSVDRTGTQAALSRECTMTITASVLYDLVQCPQRVALDAFGDTADRDEINAFVRLLWERGTLFERETIAKLSEPCTDLSKTRDGDRERVRSKVVQSRCGFS
jgi:hypothetical protein